MAKLNDDPHSFPVRLITKIRDSFYSLCFDQLRDLLDQVCFVDEIRKFCDDNAMFTVVHCFNIRDRPGNDLSLSGQIGLGGSGSAHDNTAGGKVRRLNDGQKL